jgi:hypothetical protein
MISYKDANSDILDDGNPLTVGHNPNLKPIEQTVPAKKIDISADWVQCNLCTNKVFIRYLDQHLKVHIHQYEKGGASTRVSTKEPLTSSTALVRVHDTPLQSSNTQTSWSSSTPSKKEPRLQSLETYKFRSLDNVCAASSVSKTGRYSDFTIVFYGDERVSVHNSNYYTEGAQSWTTKEWERLQIHIIYDSLEDYYTMSCKLFRRSDYSSYDSGDDSVPDRICYQHELLTEIKRALLFFKMSPKTAYKKFRKLFKEGFDITYDSDRAVIVESASCAELNKRMKNVFNSPQSNLPTRYSENESRQDWSL